MHGVKQAISAAHIVDVDGIGVKPGAGPGLRNGEPVAAILEARLAGHDHRMSDAEGMLASKAGAEPVFWNAAASLIVIFMLFGLGMIVVAFFLRTIVVLITVMVFVFFVSVAWRLIPLIVLG